MKGLNGTRPSGGVLTNTVEGVFRGQKKEVAYKLDRFSKIVCLIDSCSFQLCSRLAFTFPIPQMIIAMDAAIIKDHTTN
jgi:hypothetical protein